MKKTLRNRKVFSSNVDSPTVLTICSGKGGVGKSVLAANIAYTCAKSGIKTLIWDADSQFPNQHLIFGVEPPTRVYDVYLGNVSVNSAIYPIDISLDLLADQPASGYAEQFTDNFIVETYGQLLLDTDYELIIIDAPAGANHHVIQCCNVADYVSVIITDEPTSLLDAYGLIKILLKYLHQEKILLTVNNVIDLEDAEEISRKLNLATHKFLKVEFDILGFVLYDRLVRQSIIKQELLVQIAPDSEVAKCIKNLADRISDKITINQNLM